MIEFDDILPISAAVLASISLLCLIEAASILMNQTSSTSRRALLTSTLSQRISQRIYAIRLHVLLSISSAVAYVYLCSCLQSSADNWALLPPWDLLHVDFSASSWNRWAVYLFLMIPILTVGVQYSIFFSSFRQISSSSSATKSRSSKETPSNSNNPSSSSSSSSSSPFESNEIQLDMMYLASNFLPSTTHYDALFYISTTPSCLQFATEIINRVEQLKKERLDVLKKSKKDKERRQAALTMFDTALNGGGWADDDNDKEEEENHPKTKSMEPRQDDDDEEDRTMEAMREAKEAKARAEKEKELLAKQLAEATGKTSLAENIVLETVDEGVIGQKWVEKTLASVGQWPPIFMKKNTSLAEKTFPMENKRNRIIHVSPMDHPSVRRTLCITAGRLNSQMLNSHSELVEASQKNRVDSTYFKSAAEFRQRACLIIEGSFHLAASVKSYRLAKTLIETHVMFKVGVLSISHPQTIEWFRNTMASTYGGPDGIPALEFRSKSITTPDENEIATGDLCALELDIERKHADNFTKQKIEQCTKQGIPPQIALSAYREIWWILIRAKNMNEATSAETLEPLEINASSEGAKWLDPVRLNKFESEEEENRLLHMFPFVVPNVAQKAGKLTVRFMAPKKPGQYKFFVDVKSGEFLGCDHEFTLVEDIVDRSTVQRVEKPKKDSVPSTNSDA